MSDTNGTATQGENRITDAGSEAPKRKLSKFKKLLSLAQNAKTVKPKLSLTVKTEEGKVTGTLASIPALTPTGVKEAASLEGVKFSIAPEAGVGACEAKASGSKVEADAVEFVKEMMEG